MNKGDTILLTSVVEHDEGTRESGFTVTRISITGEPAASALVNAVADNYHRVTGRAEVSASLLEEKVGEKVTLIVGASNTFGGGMIVAREGTVFASSRGAGVAMLPKGKRKNGFTINPETVIDVIDGYDPAEAQRLVAEVRGQYPDLRNLTKERLLELPRSSKTCSLAVFGTYATPADVASDALWLIGSYAKDDDICDDGVLLVRPEDGVSEHGSCYGQQLLDNRAVGEVVDFEPITFRRAVELTELDFDTALAELFGKTALVAS